MNYIKPIALAQLAGPPLIIMKWKVRMWVQESQCTRITYQ